MGRTGFSTHIVFYTVLLLFCLTFHVGASEPGKTYQRLRSAQLGKDMGNGLIISGGTTHRIIHFTFDDGPDPKLTPRLLDILDQASIKATFFFSMSRFSSHAKRNKDVLKVAREVFERGHTIGSHSVVHQRMFRLSRAKVTQQVNESERLFIELFGERAWLFRPPFGSRSRHVDQLLAQRGYTTVLWNIGMADWLQDSAESVLHTFRRVLARMEREKGHRGGVVLLHDTHQWSVDGFKLIHQEIMNRNCNLLEQGEELYDIVDDLQLFVVPRTDEKPDTFAPPLNLSTERLKKRQSVLRKETRQRCRSYEKNANLESRMLVPDV